MNNKKSSGLGLLRVLHAVIWTGYLNKVRTYRFLVILCLTIIVGYVFVPRSDAGYVTLAWGSSTTFYRGVYNSAWIGSMVAMLTGAFLSLLGFFIVNDTVKRDEETRVGQIIATTPLRNSLYMLGNALSNFVVLSTMVVVIIFTALVMQIVRGENLIIKPWALMSPFLMFVLPLMFLVGAIAVFFGTRPLLRGGVGNIAYAFSWMIGLPLLSESIDLFGIDRITSSMKAVGLASYPEMAQQGFILGGSWGLPQERTLNMFTWQGMNWTPEIIHTPLLLIGLGIAVSLLASLFFYRFDPARESKKTSKEPGEHLPDILETEKDKPVQQVISGKPGELIGPVGSLRNVVIRPLGPEVLRFRFGSVLFAEFRLALKEMDALPFIGNYGVAVVGALIITGLLLPIDTARGILLPVAWLLPVLVWSKMGTREAHHHTDQLVFSSANSLKHQFPAAYLAGVALAIFTGSGVACNLAIHADWTGLLAWLIGAFFIPSLAFCLGVWTGSSKTFEFLYIMLWYLGPINRIESLDFMGALPGSVETGVGQYYLVITMILLGLAFLGRKIQMQRK